MSDNEASLASIRVLGPLSRCTFLADPALAWELLTGDPELMRMGSTNGGPSSRPVRSRPGSLDAPFPLQERLRGVSRDVILRVAIGVVDSSRDRVAEIEEMPNEEIGARRYDPSRAERDNVLSMLVLSQPHELGLLSDREIRDELLILLIAGHETTATVLAWTLERLLRHPEALSRTLEELDDGDGETYLDRVIRESLRPKVQPLPSAAAASERRLPLK